MSIDDDGRERKRSNSLRSDNMLHTSIHNFVIERWCIIYASWEKKFNFVLYLKIFFFLEFKFWYIKYITT